jgi:predicted Rossmann-fold nucleotide-binding protein
MKVIVCGGRNFYDYPRFQQIMDTLRPIYNFSRIIHGGAKGADSLAHRFAQERNIVCKVYPANWELHGKKAGPLRNIEMLTVEQPELVIAFPGGVGTAHMVMIAKKAGVAVIEVPKI